VPMGGGARLTPGTRCAAGARRPLPPELCARAMYPVPGFLQGGQGHTAPGPGPERAAAHRHLRGLALAPHRPVSNAGSGAARAERPGGGISRRWDRAYQAGASTCGGTCGGTNGGTNDSTSGSTSGGTGGSTSGSTSGGTGGSTSGGTGGSTSSSTHPSGSARSCSHCSCSCRCPCGTCFCGPWCICTSSIGLKRAGSLFADEGLAGPSGLWGAEQPPFHHHHHLQSRRGGFSPLRPSPSAPEAPPHRHPRSTNAGTSRAQPQPHLGKGDAPTP
jgi:hypothetical protein